MGCLEEGGLTGPAQENRRDLHPRRQNPHAGFAAPDDRGFVLDGEGERRQRGSVSVLPPPFRRHQRGVDGGSRPVDGVGVAEHFQHRPVEEDMEARYRSGCLGVTQARAYGNFKRAPQRRASGGRTSYRIESAEDRTGKNTRPSLVACCHEGDAAVTASRISNWRRLAAAVLAWGGPKAWKGMLSRGVNGRTQGEERNRVQLRSRTPSCSASGCGRMRIPRSRCPRCVRSSPRFSQRSCLLRNRRT